MSIISAIMTTLSYSAFLEEAMSYELVDFLSLFSFNYIYFERGICTFGKK